MSEGTIRGGTNQDDAVLLPMNTKLYGTATVKESYWYAFTTGSSELYKITTVNKSLDSTWLDTNLIDGNGKGIKYSVAKEDGVAATMTATLSPNTVYYLHLVPRRDYSADYMLIIRDPEEQHSGYGTSDSLSAAMGTSVALDGQIYPGTNQDDSAIIPTDVKIGATVQPGVGSWFAFTTDETENPAYNIVTVNKTVDSTWLDTRLYDEFGKDLTYSVAKPDGQAANINRTLSSNTTYYIYVIPRGGEDPIDYTLQINAPAKPEPPTATIEQPEEQLVFEQPFELNETMIMFKAESAEFVDPAAAEAALKPVADVILAHPDHPILLAGTTATDGDQENRRGLSERRAEAVKKMLVDKFGVPESQLQTIGLGYADDPFVRGKDRIPEGDVNGQFVESEGAKNRRVIVLDVNDPIAQEILNK